jgi:hypothetical protein
VRVCARVCVCGSVCVSLVSAYAVAGRSWVGFPVRVIDFSPFHWTALKWVAGTLTPGIKQRERVTEDIHVMAVLRNSGASRKK